MSIYFLLRFDCECRAGALQCCLLLASTQTAGVSTIFLPAVFNIGAHLEVQRQAAARCSVSGKLAVPHVTLLHDFM